MKFLASWITLIVCFLSPPAFAVTFSLENIRVHDRIGGIREGIMVDDPASTSVPKAQVFVPQVEVVVKVSEDIKSYSLFVRAYYFDESGQRIQTYTAPSVATRLAPDSDQLDIKHPSVWPAVLPKDQRISIYFPLPNNLPATWSMVVAFGNSRGAVASSVPDDQLQNLNYPESDLVAKTLLSPDVATGDTTEIPPLIERVAVSSNASYPKFTLFLHLPHGVTDPHNVKGVFALCMLANSAQSIRDRLNRIAPVNDGDPAFAFAEAHQMAVLAWGGCGGADTNANYDEMSRDQLQATEDRFQLLADAWDTAVDGLVHDYGMPDHDFLLDGWSAAGEWATRLALTKPNRFLAVHIHVASKYDAPNPAASRVLWLLTSGELDPGADRALGFYSAVKALQYPVVFKSFVGLDHHGSPEVDQLETRFFEYVITLKRSSTNDPSNTAALDLSGFNSPPFYGDAVNQEMFPATQKDMIPPGFLVSLPTKEIADAWNK